MVWAMKLTGYLIFNIGISAKRVMGAAHITL
jgi:hypothetical protein